MPTLYLAGPDVFLPEARLLAARKKAACAAAGFEGLSPLDNDPGPHEAGPAAARAIYRANRGMMLRADAVVANLTPFRGPSADVGTVFELGFMAALGRPAFAYSLAPEGLRARTVALCPGARRVGGGWVDAEGAVIEDFGLADNLMLDCALVEGGAALVVGHGTGVAAHMAAFARCLDAARARFAAIM